jgi:RNA polymerase sigma-70 factor (ECF subfamily)
VRIIPVPVDAQIQDKESDSRSDLELVAAANGGDSAAFGILYLRYRDWVVGLALRFTDDESLALDVLQETFLYVLRKFPGFRLTANFKTFLYPAVKNLAIASKTKARRYQTTEAEMALVEVTPAPQAGGSRDDLRHVLRPLSEEHREVLLLRFVDGLDLAEIACALHVPVGTVKSRLHNALARLRADPETKRFFE